MNEIESLKDVREQLSTVLSFFPRVDSKLSTVLAVDMAMLATLSASVPGIRLISVWSALTAILTVALLVASFLFLYFGAFPSLKGGHSSVIYFKDIAARNEGKFLEDYKRQTPD